MSGVGTELKSILQPFAGAADCQSCDEKVRILDDNGPAWAEENIDTVVRWLMDSSKRMFLARLVPDWVKNEAARGLVLSAIEAAKTTKSKIDNTTGGDTAVAPIKKNPKSTKKS